MTHPSSELVEGWNEYRFWSDDFDMDLPKVFPAAREILGDLGDVLLWTAGSQSYGRLNHPAVWNGDDTMLAFFGFRNAARPSFYYAGKSEIQCTAWEAFRDAWPHGYLIQVQHRPVWDTHALWPQFEVLMWHLRGWGEPKSEQIISRARSTVLNSLTSAVAALREIVSECGGMVQRAALPPTQTERDKT